MKTQIVLLCIVGVAQATQLRGIFGICSEMCGSGCQAGYTCKSNGCGHSCVPNDGLSQLTDIFNKIQAKRQLFGACVEMCSPSGSGLLGSCPAGEECRSNGCGHTCQKISGLSHLNLNCPPVMCELYCVGGFATNANGCQVCSCKSFSSLKDILAQAIA